MTTEPDNTHSPVPAAEPLALRLSEELGPCVRRMRTRLTLGGAEILWSTEMTDLIARLRGCVLQGWNVSMREIIDTIESLDSALEAAQQLAMQRGDELIEKDAEIERLTAERDALKDVLVRNGFVRCDNLICNCGNWHARYGLKQRFDELHEAISDAGHPTCNTNGNLLLNALSELVAERDALRADAERYRWLRVTEQDERLTGEQLDAAIDAARRT